MARRQAYDVADPYEYTPRFGLHNSLRRDFQQQPQGGQAQGQGVMVPIPRDMMRSTRCYGIVQKWDPESGVGKIRELGTMEYLSASKATLDRSGGADKLPVYFYNRSVRRMDVYVGQMVEYMRVLEKSGFVAHDALPLHNFKVTFDVVRPFVNRPNFLPVHVGQLEIDTIDARQTPLRLLNRRDTHSDIQDACAQTRAHSSRPTRQPTRQASSHHDSSMSSRPTIRQDAIRQYFTRQDNLGHDSRQDSRRQDVVCHDSRQDSRRQDNLCHDSRQDSRRQDDLRRDSHQDVTTRRDARRLEERSIVKVGPSPHQEEAQTLVKNEKEKKEEEEDKEEDHSKDKTENKQEEDQEDRENQHQSDDGSHDDEEEEEEEEDTRRKDNKRKPVQRDFDEPRKRLRRVRT